MTASNPNPNKILKRECIINMNSNVGLTTKYDTCWDEENRKLKLPKVIKD